MTELAVGVMAPGFKLPATGDAVVDLSDCGGRKVVLFFYSKDNTSGCTAEVREFGELYPEFAASGAIVLGVSRDSVQTHEKFSAKLQLPFQLLSDGDSSVSKLYGVFKEKNMYGKKVMGIERSTFIIDPDGRIGQIFRKVKAAGHAKIVLAAIRSQSV